MKNLFLSPSEQRLRSGWRLLLQLLLLLLIVTFLGIPVLLLAANIPWLSADMFYFLTNSVLIAIAITLSVTFARQWFDRRTFTSLGLYWNRRAATDLVIGFFIPCLQIGLILCLEWAFGWAKVENFAWQALPAPQVVLGTLFMLIVFIFVGWGEELLARGYWLQNIEEGLNITWAVLISSSAFALGHIGNPNVSWLAIPGLFAAGLFLAYGYLRTRQLWLPIGLHIGWNFFEGTIFGFPVSGSSSIALIQTSIDGPKLFTGGAFGPEGGLIVLPALVLGIALIYYYTKKPRIDHE